MRRISTFILFFVFLSGCAHSTIIPFQVPGANQLKLYPPTQPETVGVYRSTHPFASFVELGLISYRIDQFDLIAMYHQIRKDAAQYGAQAVVDVRTSQETHVELVSKETCSDETKCEADGSCHTESVCRTDMVPEDVTTFLIVGSMIREKP